MGPTNQEKHEETYRAAEDALRGADPARLAQRAGLEWVPGESEGVGSLIVPAFGGVARIDWPDLTFRAEHPLLQTFPWRLIALHYLATATGSEPAEDWIGYREIPDGLFYANTVTREVEQPLAAAFGESAEAFLAAGRPLGGRPADLADVALVFHPLPRVPMVLALWLADEEFPAKAKVLYERSGARNLPLQDLRILADLLWSALKRERSSAEGGSATPAPPASPAAGAGGGSASPDPQGAPPASPAD